LTYFWSKVYSLSMATHLRPQRDLIPPVLILLLGFTVPPVTLVNAATVTVRPGGSIQAAVDGAPAGSTVVVLPGIYHERGWPHAVTVTKDDIRLVARPRPGHPVVIERTAGQENGIWVSPADTLAPDDTELPPCGESGLRVRKFSIKGFTVRGFPGYGIFLACVDGFAIRNNTAVENRTYSIFPIRSSRGRVTRNRAAGTLTDACIYVGQSEDVVVDHNRASDCQIGFQLENTRNVRMRHNRATGNTAGLIVDVIAYHQTLVAADNSVTRNVFADNNRPNSGPGSETEDLVPGIGVVIDGADRTVLSHNLVTKHQLSGLTLVNYCIGDPDACTDPRLAIDPYPDGNRVLRNRFVANTANVIFIPGAGQDNCFKGNRPSLLDPNVSLPSCS
jgi:parallel beta-helix repeat protein